MEIIIGSRDDYLHCLNHTGDLQWKFHTANNVESSPATADLDDDGTLEIIFGSMDNKLYCLDHLGNEEWNYTTSDYIKNSPAIADIDQDGYFDILFITDDGKSREDLLKEMGTGLLVTEVMGQGVNIVTGDYSRGASGFWVENGEIQYPVEEITIASKLQDMYQQLIYVANDTDTRGNIKTGSWLIEQMSIAGS